MDDARKMFLSSIKATPLLWASWKELARLCDDREMVLYRPTDFQKIISPHPHNTTIIFSIICRACNSLLRIYIPL